MGFADAEDDPLLDTQTKSNQELHELRLVAASFTRLARTVLRSTRVPANVPYYQRSRNGKPKRY